MLEITYNILRLVTLALAVVWLSIVIITTIKKLPFNMSVLKTRFVLSAILSALFIILAISAISLGESILTIVLDISCAIMWAVLIVMQYGELKSAKEIVDSDLHITPDSNGTIIVDVEYKEIDENND